MYQEFLPSIFYIIGSIITSAFYNVLYYQYVKNKLTSDLPPIPIVAIFWPLAIISIIVYSIYILLNKILKQLLNK